MRVKCLPIILVIFFLCFLFTKTQGQSIFVGPVTGTITVCVGTPSVSPDIQQFTVSGVNLTSAVTATAPADFEVSTSATGGYGASVTMNINGAVTGTVYVRAAAVGTPGLKVANIVLTSTNAITQNAGVVATVNPLPTVNAVSNQTVLAGAATTAVNFTGTGQIYSWINNTPGIGLAASGSGDIPSFTAINNTGLTQTATVTVTPKQASYFYAANLFGSVSMVNSVANTLVSTLIVPGGFYYTKTIVSPNGKYVYVQNLLSSIPVIDAKTNTLVNSILLPAGRYAGIMEMSPDGTKLFTIDGDGVLVFSTATNNLIATINFPTGGVPAVFSADGQHIYVAGSSFNNIKVINTSTYLVEATISGLNGPKVIAITPDSKFLYVANTNGSNICAVNTSTNTIIANIPLVGAPYDLKISADGKKVYVTSPGVNVVSIIDVATNKIIVPLGVGFNPQQMAVSSDGKYVYVANRSSGAISIIDGTTNMVLRSSPSIGGSPTYLMLSPDNSRLYVSEDNSSFIKVINTLTNTVIDNVDTHSARPLLGALSFSHYDDCDGTPTTFTITVNPPPPAINVVGAPGAVSTSYGAASISGSFSLAGVSLQGPVTVTPPAGFEVSTDNINFSPTLSILNNGNLLSTMIYTRLTAVTNAGTYAGNVVLSSPGAVSVDVAIPSSIVNPQVLNITGTYAKIYGDILTNTTLYYNTPGVTFTNPAFKNGNSFNSIAIAFSAGTRATDATGLYHNVVSISNLTGRNGYLSSNYTVTYSPIDLIILPAPLTITVNKVTKPYGAALTNTINSTDFTVTGIKNSETVGSISVSYGAGAAAGATVGTYPGSVVASAAAGGTFLPANYDITYIPAELDVTPPLPPVITVESSPQPVNTIYGTPSAPTNFNISAINLLSGVVVTAPPGFEVSTNNVTFSNTVTVGSVGSLNSVPVYIRLAAITNVGPYTGNIVLTSAATTTNVLMPSSIVSPAPLTISGINETKYYGDVLTNLISSNKFTITAGSLKNGNTITGVAIAYGIGSEAQAICSLYVNEVTITGINGANGFLESNYAINFLPANINVLPATLTITANNISKTYGSALSSGITNVLFTAKGLKNSETVASVTLTYHAGSAAADNAGEYTGEIEASSPIGGTFAASNYKVSYVPGDLTVTPAPLTITAVDAAKNYGSQNPVFSVTYSGFVNGDSEAQLTKLPAISTTATTGSDGGKYPIKASSASALNYLITYVDGVLTIAPPVDLVIPNTFTPNADGINDTWKIPALASYPNCSVQIFNRYGAKVYNSIGYGMPWDGTVNGSDAPVGVYYYSIDTKVRGINASGSITVIR
jgi:gliding motility-associated-like protein